MVKAGVQTFQRSVLVATALFVGSIARVQAEVEVSTITANRVQYDEESGFALAEGDAKLVSTTATLTADRLSLDTREKTGVAQGNVRIESASGTITGTEAEYHWEASTGTIKGASGENPPWRFWAGQLWQRGPNLFEMDEGLLTSCNADPPHYTINASHGNLRPRQRATMKNARLVLDETPSFWFPLYSRSLRPKKYTLRVEPGHSERDGYMARTTLGYPFSQNTFTKFRWDYLQDTGNGWGLEHRYATPDIRGDFDSYYIRDTNPDPKPESRRYSLLWNHFQRFTPRLTVNGKIDVKSDQAFGNQFENVGNDIRVENQTRGIDSQGGLNYQFPRAALQFQLDRRDRFDSSVSSSSFISKLTLPRVTYNTIPLTWRYFPVYTSFAASFTNETINRTSPQQTLRYQQAAGAAVQMKKDLRLRKKTTLTPVGTYSENWQDRDPSLPSSSSDIYVGRYTVGFDLRQRFGRLVDGTVDYRYGERFRQNQVMADSAADDQGIETNRMNVSVVGSIGRDTRATVSSGYDFRNAPSSDPEKYAHRSARITSPTADLQWQATPVVSVYLRETYSLYDTQSRSTVLTPLNTAGEVQVGNPLGRTFFSQGFSFTKPPPGAPSELLLNNKVRFYPSPKWHIDLYLSYKAYADKDMQYRKLAAIEKTFRVTRDLHCWLFRMEFSDRPGRTEASFFIDLKTNLTAHRDVFSDTGHLPEAELDVSDVFSGPSGGGELPPGAENPG